MGSLKDIKRRLRSVRSTRKITYAMKLVSAAKLKKAQDGALNFHVYTEQLDKLLLKLLAEAREGPLRKVPEHPLMIERSEIKNVGLVIVGGQRGLCGGYNHNLHKRAEVILREKKEQYPEAQLHVYILGKKPAEYFRRRGFPYTEAYEDLPDAVNRWPIEELALKLEESFLSGGLDRVWLLYTRFVSTMTHPPVCEQLLPLQVSATAAEQEESNLAVLVPGLTLFEPSSRQVFSAILPKILRSKIQQACHDAKAGEIASRMTAMDAATRNAEDLGRKLELMHNKLRQLRITSELLDIIGGAEAIK